MNGMKTFPIETDDDIPNRVSDRTLWTGWKPRGSIARWGKFLVYLTGLYERDENVFILGNCLYSFFVYLTGLYERDENMIAVASKPYLTMVYLTGLYERDENEFLPP